MLYGTKPYKRRSLFSPPFAPTPWNISLKQSIAFFFPSLQLLRDEDGNLKTAAWEFLFTWWHSVIAI